MLRPLEPFGTSYSAPNARCQLLFINRFYMCTRWKYDSVATAHQKLENGRNKTHVAGTHHLVFYNKSRDESLRQIDEDCSRLRSVHLNA